jgi:hypothetical protein
MSNPSNLYAEKVFSEHPIALWPLDDIADYVSLISEQNRDFTLWEIDNGSAEEIPSILDEPFPNSFVSKVLASSADAREFSVSCVSPNIVSLQSLNESLATISVGAFLYSNTAYISGFDIGYEYYDDVSGSTIQDLKFFSTEIYNNWIFVSETFAPPRQNSTFRVVIKARFFEGDDLENYSFLANGVSIGQWAEEFNSTSLGSTPVSVPSNILGSSGITAIEASAYGLQDLNGYYLVRRNALSAKNYGVPMVYGANNTTTLQQIGNAPAILLPGLGFLNESGKYKDYTFEFWLRANCNSSEEKRIFGNVRGTDGIYVNGPFISLKIGDHVIKHYVGQWSRPMLVHIRYSSSSISLIINGEQVGEKIIIAADVNLPPITQQSGQLVLDNDWLGFWAYEDVFPLEIDAVATYGYKVPNQVAKRRFVYGQGVEFPENINNAYSGSSVFIDYPFSKYSKNYNYPNIAKWSQGAYDNIRINGNALSFPQYNQPTVLFSDKTYDQWIADLKTYSASDMAISLKPGTQWSETDGYIYVENLSIASETAKAIYVSCQEVDVADSPQTIFLVENKVSGGYFEVVLRSDRIDYIVFDGNVQTIVASKERYFLGEQFIVGIDLQKFSNYYGGKVAQFFGNLSTMSLYVGGRKDFSQTFTGKIYSIGVCSSKNIAKIESIFGQDGVGFSDEFVDGNIGPDIADAELYNTQIYQFLYDGGTLGQYAQLAVSGHIATYHLSLVDSMSGFGIRIGADSYWQDYVPLSALSKQVRDASGDDRLDLDFVQFNIDYPAPSRFIQEETSGSWTYGELQSEYSNPLQRSYESLDNHLFTGFDNYLDLKNRSQNTYRYDTSGSVVRTYVSFQLLAEGANKPSEYFSNTELAPKDGILIPGDGWINTKYEVVDNMIIYPPASVSFEDIAIVAHIHAQTVNIEDSPILIRSMEYASLALSETAPTPIGTRFGNDIFPYRKDGFYFTYKQKNPFTIYKGSTPYLYLTKDSGISIKGQYDPMVNRGISIPINQSRADSYKVIAMQMSLKFDQDFFPYAPTQIFEIQSKNSYIKFFMVATHPQGKRAKIYAINSRGQLENGLSFYLNGKLVKDPTITVQEWAMLGIRFANTQDFNSYEGALRLNGPMTFNNISHYKSTNLQEVQTVVERPWFKVEKAGSLTLDWNYWNAIPYLWQEVLVISNTSYYGVDPSDIYKVYTGTNKIIVDDSVETKFGDYAYKFYNNVTWKTNTYQAV